MIFISLGLSALLLVGLFLTARKSPVPVAKLACMGAVAMVGPMCLAMIAVPLQLQGLAAIATLVLLAIPRYGRRLYLGTAVLTVLVAYAVAFYNAVEQQRQIAALQERYSYEPLAARLPARPATVAPAAADPKWLDKLESWLDESPADFRTRALRRLHDERVSHFVTTPGFGPVRMVPLTPSEGTLALGLRPAAGVPKPADAPGRSRSAGDPPPKWSADALDDLHAAGVADFANPAGFGLVRDRQVAGFQSHGFSRVPDPKAGWRVADLDLIGLLLHEAPVAYVSKNLPRMDELKAATTRPLDPFEADAVDRLRKGEEVVVKASANGLRMVGAVRAAKQCVECHGGGRGDLLGAFSYQLRPAE